MLAAGVLKAEMCDPEPMWLFCAEGREEVKVWPMALGQKCQDVMGSDPRPFLRSCPEQSLQRNAPKDTAWGNLTPNTSQRQVLQPGWMALQPRLVGTGRILTPGMLPGVLALPLSLFSCKARFCTVTPQLCYSSAVP